MHPLGLGVPGAGDLHDDVMDSLSGDHTVDRRIERTEWMIVAVFEHVVAAIRVDIGAEISDAFRAVHCEGGIVGPGYALVGVDQDHALAKARNDLLELRSIDLFRHINLFIQRVADLSTSVWRQGRNGLRRADLRSARQSRTIAISHPAVSRQDSPEQ